MSAHSIEPSSSTELTEQQKLSLNIQEILRTTEMMVTRTNEIKQLQQELLMKMDELRSMQSEVNTIAVKYGLEPVSVHEMQSSMAKPDGIPVSIPLPVPE